MITYANGTSVSIDAKSTSFSFKPIITIKKDILPFTITHENELAEFNSLIASATYKGYALFKNDQDSEPIETNEGCSNGGVIYIGKEYVFIGYLSGYSSFQVYKLDGAVLNRSFHSISPLVYISSVASRFIGEAPSGYLPYQNGVIESFTNEVCLNLPEFSRAMIVNGVPFAYFGLSTGTLGLNCIPTTKRGIAKALLLNKLYASECKKYPDDKGVILTTSTRNRAKTLISAIASGRDKLDVNFSVLYKCPESLLMSSAANYYAMKVVSEAEYNVVDELAFPPSDLEVGVGITTYINNPTFENARYTFNSPDVQEILEQYKAKLEELRKQGLIPMVVENSNQLCNILQYFYGATVSYSGMVKFESSIFPHQKEVTISFDGLSLPKPDIKFKRYTTSELSALKSDEIKSKYCESMDKLAVISDVITANEKKITIGNEQLSLVQYKFDQTKFDDLYAKIGAEIGDIVSKRLSKVLTSIANSSEVFIPNHVNYVYRHKCHKDTCTIDGYKSQQGAMSAPNNLWANGGCNQNGVYDVASSLKINKANYIQNVVLDNMVYDAATQKIKFGLSLRLIITPAAEIDCGQTFSVVQGDMCNWLRNTLAAAGVDGSVTAGGVVNINPLGLAISNRRVGRHSTHFQASNALGPNTITCPSFTYSVKINDSVSMIQPSFDSKSDEVSQNGIKNLNVLENSAEQQAVVWLVDQLMSKGLLKDVRITGQIVDTNILVTDLVRFANFDVSSTLKIFVNAYDEILKVTTLSDGERAQVEFNRTELLNALALCGITRDSEKGWVENKRVWELPWIMDFASMKYTPLKVDFNLLPFYASM